MQDNERSAIREIGQALFDAFLSQYGPAFTLLVVVIIVLFILYERSHRALARRQQAEIERLVEERNWYQALVTERLSSQSPALPSGSSHETPGN